MMAVLLPNGKQAFSTAGGDPLVGGKVYTFAAGTTTPAPTFADASGQVPNTNPVILDARGEATIFWDGAYKVVLRDATGNLIWSLDNVSTVDPLVAQFAALKSGLASASDDTLLGFRQGGSGAALRSLFAKAREHVSVADFHQSGDADDTAAFFRARDYCQATGLPLYIPAGSYTLSDTVVMSRSFDILGEGAERTIITMVTGEIKPIFHLKPANGAVILGIRLSGMQLRCNGGAVSSDGIKISTGTDNSTCRQCEISNLWIRDTETGVSISGVFYRVTLSNITVQGVRRFGLYSDIDFIDVTYNTFSQLEVTNVANGAYAYYLRSPNTIFSMLTSDGVSYFSSPGGIWSGYKLETIQATAFPSAMGSACVLLNQMQLIDAPSCIGVDPAKRATFLKIIGTSTTVRGVRFTPPQPINAFELDGGSSGTVDGCYMKDGAHNLIEDTHSNATLNRWTFQACEDVTKRGLVSQMDMWTPSFSAEWAVTPTEVAGTYRKVGGKVMYIVSGRGGTCTAGARIGGAPVLHTTVGVGRLVSPTQASDCSILAGTSNPNSSDFINFRAMTIPSGDYWQLVVEAGA